MKIWKTLPTTVLGLALTGFTLIAPAKASTGDINCQFAHHDEVCPTELGSGRYNSRDAYGGDTLSYSLKDTGYGYDEPRHVRVAAVPPIHNSGFDCRDFDPNGIYPVQCVGLTGSEGGGNESPAASSESPGDSGKGC